MEVNFCFFLVLIFAPFCFASESAFYKLGLDQNGPQYDNGLIQQLIDTVKDVKLHELDMEQELLALKRNLETQNAKVDSLEAKLDIQAKETAAQR